MGDKKSGVFAKIKKKLVSFGICGAIMVACLGSLWHHYHEQQSDDMIGAMENKLLDLRFRLRGERKPTGKVGILAIDEKALQKFGRWPISRKYYEQAFMNLKKLGATWVGFDVVWSADERPEIDDITPSLQKLKALDGKDWKATLGAELASIDAQSKQSLADQAMARMIKNYGKIVLGFFYYASKQEASSLGDKRFAGLDHMQNSALQALVFPDGMDLSKYSFLRAHGIVANTEYIGGHAEAFAFFNNESDPDAIMRWVTLVREINGNLMPSLSLKLAAQVTEREPVVFFDQFGITDISLMNPNDDQDLIKIPVDHNGYGRILINHLGPGETIPHFSLADAYDNSFTPEEKKSLKGKALLLGPTAIAINDQRANPFDAGINGVENHAAVVDNVISGKFMRRSDSIYLTELMIVLAIGLLFAPLMIFTNAALSGVAAALFLAGYYLFDKYMWFGKGEWVYMGMPFIEITSMFVAETLYKYMVEEGEKRKVKGAFSVYLAPEVIEQFLENPEALEKGERKDVTVFFSDVRSFTTISEGLSPEKLRDLMNSYFHPMLDIVMGSKGMLDKLIGDAIMAFWGTPIPLPNHAESAAVASVQMLFALDKLRADFPKRGLPPIDIGIGLSSGPASVGNMGAPQRAAYTAMGDTVNLGARLESLTKEYGVKIMISQVTQSRLTRKDLFTRDLDDIRVKGKLEPVKVFELMRPDMLRNEQQMRDLIGAFELGRAAYRAQDWDKAKKHFMTCLTLRPDDGPAELFLRRVEEAEALPKVESWDGVYTFKHK